METLEDTQMMNTSDIQFHFTAQDMGLLFYTCGNQVVIRKVSLPQLSDEMTDEPASEHEASPKIFNTFPLPSFLVNSSNSNKSTPPPSPVTQQPPALQQHVGSKPSYMLYNQVFNYFVNVLLYSSSAIATIIEELHKNDILPTCKTFDGQIDAVAEALNKFERKNKKNVSNENTTLSKEGKINFQIHVQPYKSTSTAVNNSATTTTTTVTTTTTTSTIASNAPKNIYTDEELALDFDTRTELFYQRV